MSNQEYKAYRDCDARWRLRKVVLEVYVDKQLVYRARYFTSLFPRLKYKLAKRCIKRLQEMKGA